MTCQCGSTQFTEADGQHMCNQCGSIFEEQQAPAAASTGGALVCANCGNNDPAQFLAEGGQHICAQCGGIIEEQTAAPKAVAKIGTGGGGTGKPGKVTVNSLRTGSTVSANPTTMAMLLGSNSRPARRRLTTSARTTGDDPTGGLLHIEPVVGKRIEQIAKVKGYTCQSCGGVSYVANAADPAPLPCKHCGKNSDPQRFTAGPGLIIPPEDRVCQMPGCFDPLSPVECANDDCAHVGQEMVLNCPLCSQPYLLQFDEANGRFYMTCETAGCAQKGINRRVECPFCNSPIRPARVRLKKDEGVCPECATPYDFKPIPSGQLISGFIENLGPAFIGGCGFVYAMHDTNLGRPCIVKAVINSSDPMALEAALQEKAFLVELSGHPSVVKVFAFVKHKGKPLLVMEYIDGVTLEQLVEKKGKLPVAEALAYALQIVPGIGSIHEKGFLYMDGKAKNFMKQGRRIRIIDLGGCRAIDDTVSQRAKLGQKPSPFYYTPGMAGPEATSEPTRASDWFTIGRTLADITIDLDLNAHFYDLPTPQEEAVFARYESYYRLLLLLTREDANLRPQDAADVEAQIRGVLREVIALDTGNSPHVESDLFALELSGDTTKLSWRQLPSFKLSPDDTARGIIESALAMGEAGKQEPHFRQAIVQFPDSHEAPLRLVSCLIDQERFEEAARLLTPLNDKESAVLSNIANGTQPQQALMANGLIQSGTDVKALVEEIQLRSRIDEFDWRRIWLLGKLHLAQGRAGDAYKHFDAVYSELPGELAPKLALAMAAEASSQLDIAVRFYHLVSRVDPVTYLVANFGLARCLLALGTQSQAAADIDVDDFFSQALDALRRVPSVSMAYTASLYERVNALLLNFTKTGDRGKLTAADEVFAEIRTVSEETLRLRVQVYRSVAAKLADGTLHADANQQVLGVPMVEDKLLQAACDTLIECARRFAQTSEEKEQLIVEALGHRKWRWF